MRPTPTRSRAVTSEGVWIAAKLYPANATTNSASGVTDIGNIHPALERMQRIGMPLCVHGEVTDPDVDVFDREAVFIERVLAAGPRLPRAEDRVRAYHHGRGRGLRARQRTRTSPRRSRRSICIINRNALFAGGLRPHAYCLPVAKREKHRLAFARRRPRARPNSSSAPTARRMRAHAKESAAAAPAFSTRPFALESYAQCSTRRARSTSSRALLPSMAPTFYGLPLNEGTVTLERTENDVPDRLGVGTSTSCRSTPGRP